MQLKFLVGVGQPLVFCLACGECLGKYRQCYAKEHLQKFPDHKKGFFVAHLKDGLSK